NLDTNIRVNTLSVGLLLFNIAELLKIFHCTYFNNAFTCNLCNSHTSKSLSSYSGGNIPRGPYTFDTIDPNIDQSSTKSFGRYGSTNRLLKYVFKSCSSTAVMSFFCPSITVQLLSLLVHD